MASKVVISDDKIEGRMDEIGEWLQKNAGQGSARYGGQKNSIVHWLNGDDWLYFSLYTLGDQDKDEPYILDNSTVFVFRKEEVAVEFALRFA
jgi:hypothetical protein